MSLYLLDSSALLAVFRKEKGHEFVEHLLGDCCIHALHVSEVARKLLSLGFNSVDTRTMIEDIQIPVLSELNVDEAILAATYSETWKHIGLSLADRICLSISRLTGLEVITADQRWGDVKHETRILLLR